MQGTTKRKKCVFKRLSRKICTYAIEMYFLPLESLTLSDFQFCVLTGVMPGTFETLPKYIVSDNMDQNLLIFSLNNLSCFDF